MQNLYEPLFFVSASYLQLARHNPARSGERESWQANHPAPRDNSVRRGQPGEQGDHELAYRAGDSRRWEHYHHNGDDENDNPGRIMTTGSILF